jgi:hypothetical protein
MALQTEPESTDVLSPCEAAKFLGLATATLAKLRCRGGSPEYLKLGRRVVYERHLLDAWRRQRRVRNTSDSDRLPPRLTDDVAS